MKIRTSGPTTPPRRRRGAAGGALYGAVKGDLPAPTCLAGQQEETDANEDHRPHRSPFDPAKDAGIRGQQQHPKSDEHNACRARVVAMLAVRLDVFLRTPPIFSCWRSTRTDALFTSFGRATHIVGHAAGLLGKTLGLRVKLVGPIAPDVATWSPHARFPPVGGPRGPPRRPCRACSIVSCPMRRRWVARWCTVGGPQLILRDVRRSREE